MFRSILSSLLVAVSLFAAVRKWTVLIEFVHGSAVRGGCFPMYAQWSVCSPAPQAMAACVHSREHPYVRRS
jgi:hypothetical protein